MLTVIFFKPGTGHSVSGVPDSTHVAGGPSEGVASAVERDSVCVGSCWMIFCRTLLKLTAVAARLNSFSSSRNWASSPVICLNLFEAIVCSCGGQRPPHHRVLEAER